MSLLGNRLLIQQLTVDDYRDRLKDGGMKQAVGQRVKRLRQRKEWTQAQLAEKAGVTENTIRGLERNTRVTQWPKLQAIAKALGTSPEALMHGDDPIEPSDPRLDRLTDEDLLVARRFHDARTSMRQRVMTLLHEGEPERVSTLIPRLVKLTGEQFGLLEEFVTSMEYKAVAVVPTKPPATPTKPARIHDMGRPK
jgi:transcriptional regulator with XRE-family HTH domain